ncbi:MAG: acyl-CoA dehydrogenase family protein [Deltaproteobacteria bacterium]|nr:acyl-CoA dehydrogenase family protein [Deltaproteobacteria bacterium]
MQDNEIFTEDHQAFRRTVRKFADGLAPHSEAWDEAGIFPREVFTQAAELGLLGIRVDPQWGGSGLDWWYTTAYAEALVHTRNAGVNMALMVQSDMATPIISEIGSDEVKREFLEPAVKGEKIAALGVSEPGGGSDVAAIRTTARRDGDDFIINGQKLWITNGTRADFITLAVRTGDDGYGGISLLVFPTDTKGFHVGKKLKKIGNKASDTAELFFEDCRVPRRYLLGEENMGFYHIMTNFQGERLIAAVSCVAGMELAVRDAIAYGDDRKAFGKPISKFQVWRHKLVEHMTAIEAARRLTYFAVDKFNKNPANATREITMAKLFAGDLAQRVIYDCQQMYGGFGYVTEYAVARAFTDIRLITIGGGTSEVMKEILVKMEGL